MKTTLIIAALLYATPAAADEWTWTDTGLEVIFSATLVLDYSQTQRGIEGCREVNPIMGPCGERVPPSVYFPVVALAHAGVTAVLPTQWRRLWQGVTIGASSFNVWRNGMEVGYALQW